ncbi:acetolactate decarboxylase [Gluconacetobacter sacchari]|uniref:acetolactate decarboxylase n=1 Tax=Gluconacetobacter sacchari TaxID=92759 RepID=UPI0039B5A45C
MNMETITRLKSGVCLIGDLREIGSNTLNYEVPLGEVLNVGPVYGLGMFTGLRGELLIMDSDVRLGEFVGARDYRIRSAEPADRVAFLAFGRVTQWKELPIPDRISAFQDLEEFVPEAAASAGVDRTEPFFFRIRAGVKYLKWFIVDGMGNLLPNPRSSFERARYLGGIDDTEIDALGVYSPGVKGVFTNAVSHIHLHFRTTAGDDFVGHVDDEILLKPGGAIYFGTNG